MPKRDLEEAKKLAVAYMTDNRLPGTKVLDAWEGSGYYVFTVGAEDWSPYDVPFVVVPDEGRITVHSTPGNWFRGVQKVPS